MYVFFFSSRRRHTRYIGDWSSDVCSSDLDVIPPRDRGKYQGFVGGVFGVSTIVGPLLGGFFVDNLTWRWIFYINLPVGAIALAVIAVVFQIGRASCRERGEICVGGGGV